MITPDQARERAMPAFKDDPDEPGSIGLYEFDEGYVCWLIPPARENPDRPPDTIGGGVVVIDRDSGELSTWPNLPAPIIAENYRRRLRGEPATWDQ